jgi:GTP pyrophosphokinase
VAAQVFGRPKHIYSIARKMQRKHVGFEQLFDVRAVRIVVESIADCYAALGVVHGLWHYIPGRIRRLHRHPKDNEYRSIHTAVIGPEAKSLEVQIRSQRHACPGRTRRRRALALQGRRRARCAL